MAMPSSTGLFNVTVSPDNRDGGLSMSDKIALGVGVGFGIPTVVIGVGTLVCVRKRKAKAAKQLEDASKENAEDTAAASESPQMSSGETAVTPETEAQPPRA